MFMRQLSRGFKTSSPKTVKDVVILSTARTPVGSFLGSLSSQSATSLGAVAVKAVVERSGLKSDAVEECIMGNVVGANLGQAPARQAALMAGLPESTRCTTINKVCSSGMKSITLGAQSIALGMSKVVVAGGMESMSNTPYYLEGARNGLGLGDKKIVDGIIKDGLWDSKYQIHMGECAEATAEKFGIGREAQDAFAQESYERAARAVKSGQFKAEIVPVKIASRKGEVVVSEDEEYTKIDFDKMRKLKPAFKKENGTVTAANASTLSDGASAVVLMEAELAESRGLKPVARILSYADAECNPKDFPIAPSLAIPIALERAGLKVSDISLFEINEAFSVVVRANEQILGLNPSKVNVAGGAVSLGHPIGSSGCRIVVTLVNLLKAGQIGCAAICNGGGGATAIIIEKL